MSNFWSWGFVGLLGFVSFEAKGIRVVEFNSGCRGFSAMRRKFIRICVEIAPDYSSTTVQRHCTGELRVSDSVKKAGE